MRRLSIALTAVLLLAACGSTGGLGDILGGILGSSSPQQSSDVRGVVNSVDTQNQRIDLNVSTVNNLRQSNTTGSIYWNSNTRVQFNNKTYRPEDLERGDEISVQGANDNGRYVARTITVTRNVRG